ncbi:F-box/WD repeat-containing protein 9-like [Clytia hemisphaerica]|uniref:F-box domain-containing protein n=1 Tax=Clytia hemisphaerica TaxID=252671 RepID=A0A7M5VCB4_9CNID|eukprot:TCONS_00018310-protein
MLTEINNIEDLPPELLLNIFRFIDVRTLFGKVVLTCKYFHDILTAEGIWQTLFALKWKEHKVVTDVDYIKSWGKVYMAFEDIEIFWKKNSGKRLVKKKLVGHSGTVDALHIMPSRKIYISGGRDRNAMVWRSKHDGYEGQELLEVLQHKGWVWGICSDENKDSEFITTSFAPEVNVWNIERLDLVNTFDYHPGAVLSLCCQDQVLTTGCFDKKLRQFDLRSGKLTLELAHHKKPVVSLCLTENYLFSGSADKTIRIYDTRVPEKELTKLILDSQALCMNTAQEQGLSFLRVGGSHGGMFFFDISDGCRFSLLNSFDIWNNHNQKVTDICNFRGCLVACSDGGPVRAYTPGRDCAFIRRLDDPLMKVGMCSCYSRGDVMLTGGSDSCVTEWRFENED